MKITLALIIIISLILAIAIFTLLCSPNASEKELEDDEQEKFVSNYNKAK